MQRLMKSIAKWQQQKIGGPNTEEEERLQYRRGGEMNLEQTINISIKLKQPTYACH